MSSGKPCERRSGPTVGGVPQAQLLQITIGKRGDSEEEDTIGEVTTLRDFETAQPRLGRWRREPTCHAI